MKYIKFVSWAWNRLDYSIRAIVTIIGLIGTFVLSGVIWGAMGLVGWLIMLAGVFLLFLLGLIIEHIKDEWKLYNERIEEEKDRVVAILRGR